MVAVTSVLTSFFTSMITSRQIIDSKRADRLEVMRDDMAKYLSLMTVSVYGERPFSETDRRETLMLLLKLEMCFDDFEFEEQDSLNASMNNFADLFGKMLEQYPNDSFVVNKHREEYLKEIGSINYWFRKFSFVEGEKLRRSTIFH